MHKLNQLPPRYRPIKLYQQTLTSQIYVVEDQHRFQEICLLKVFAPQQSLENWQRESHILYRLEHPQIPRFRECWQNAEGLFLVTDYFEGKTYAQLRESKRFSEGEVTELLEQILPLLDYLHQQGIRQGNLSPENIICRQGDLLPCFWDFSQAQEESDLENYHDLRALAVTLVSLPTGQKNPPHPAEIWQKEVEIGSRLNQFLSKFLTPQENLPDSTIVTLTPATTPQPVKGKVKATPPKILRPGCWLQTLLWLGVIFGFGSLGWLGAKFWLARLKQAPVVEITPSPQPNSTPFAAEQEEWNRLATLRDRRLKLGIDPQFFQGLVDQVFAQRYPELLTSSPQEIRTKKDTLALKLLDGLEGLSEKNRQNLGNYNREKLREWTQEVNVLHLSSRALYDLTDAAFFHAFPEETQQPTLDQPLGQVWAAFAADVIETLNLGDRHEEISLDETNPVFERMGFLQPGEGQAFVVSLQAGQNLEINLDADQSTRLSIYSPTGRNNLLEDSTEKHWSGSLPETGYFEIIVVSQANQPLSFELTLKRLSETL